MFIDSQQFSMCPKLKDVDVKCERDEYIQQHPRVTIGQYFVRMHKLHDICLTCANKYEGR